MIKIFKVTLPILVVVIMLLGSVSLVQASLWLKGTGFYYSPSYGELAKELDRVSPFFETLKNLESGPGASFSIGYDFSENWSARLDAFSFTGTADYHHLRLPETYLFKTSVSPIIFSALYRIPSQGRLRPYLGVGLGSFSSELTIRVNIGGGEFEKHYRDSPLGFQVLAGTDYRLAGGFFLCGELRYLLAEAQYPGYKGLAGCSTDWSGFFLSMGIGYRFGAIKIGVKVS